MQPNDRHEAEIEAIWRDVSSGPGVTDPKVRAQVMAGSGPEGLVDFLDKVRHASYRTADEDIASLERAGLEEDAIFELTVAAAAGIAYERLLAAKRAMQVPS
jgi:alkylhydroperoxidase family enzyme